MLVQIFASSACTGVVRTIGAPKTVNNFVFLARYHYFDGIAFHRIIPGFVIQGGDPTGNGTGGPGYRSRCRRARHWPQRDRHPWPARQG